MQITELNEIAEVFNGKTPSETDQKTVGFPVLKIRDVDDTGTFRGKISSFVDPNFAKAFPEKIVKHGDILVLNAAHNAAYVASKYFFVSGETVGTLATGEWTIIRAREKGYLQRLLYYWFHTEGARKQLKNFVRGIHLYPRDVSNIEVTLPDPKFQEHITTVLEKADRVRRLHRTSRGLNDTLLQSVFLKMFAGPQSTQWEQIPIEGLLVEKPNAIRTGPFGSQLLHSEFVKEGVAVLGIDNVVENNFTWGQRRFITEEKYQELERYRVFPGDVLISIMATCGRCAVVPNDIPLAINTKHLCCITLETKKCLPEYLQSCFLSHPAVLRRLGLSERGAIMPGLNMQIIKDLVIPVPPMASQKEFTEIVHQQRNLIRRHREAERQSEHFFQTLLSNAFRIN